MAIVGYARVSTAEQSVDSQVSEISTRYNVDKWFVDEAVSGLVKGKDRPELSKLLDYVRDDDAVVVYAIDRLGRNTIDVLETVEMLTEQHVSVVSLREGFDLSTDHGKLLLTMLAGLAELERKNIKARQLAGIKRAKALGKPLGRKREIDYSSVSSWRSKNSASIKETAMYFGISLASVKRACAADMS